MPLSTSIKYIRVAQTSFAQGIIDPSKILFSFFKKYREDTHFYNKHKHADFCSTIESPSKSVRNFDAHEEKRLGDLNTDLLYDEEEEDEDKVPKAIIDSINEYVNDCPDPIDPTGDFAHMIGAFVSLYPAYYYQFNLNIREMLAKNNLIYSHSRLFLCSIFQVEPTFQLAGTVQFTTQLLNALESEPPPEGIFEVVINFYTLMPPSFQAKTLACLKKLASTTSEEKEAKAKKKQAEVAQTTISTMEVWKIIDAISAICSSHEEDESATNTIKKYVKTLETFFPLLSTEVQVNVIGSLRDIAGDVMDLPTRKKTKEYLIKITDKLVKNRKTELPSVREEKEAAAETPLVKEEKTISYPDLIAKTAQCATQLKELIEQKSFSEVIRTLRSPETNYMRQFTKLTEECAWRTEQAYEEQYQADRAKGIKEPTINRADYEDILKRYELEKQSFVGWMSTWCRLFDPHRSTSMQELHKVLLNNPQGPIAYSQVAKAIHADSKNRYRMRLFVNGHQRDCKNTGTDKAILRFHNAFGLNNKKGG